MNVKDLKVGDKVYLKSYSRRISGDAVEKPSEYVVTKVGRKWVHIRDVQGFHRDIERISVESVMPCPVYQSPTRGGCVPFVYASQAQFDTELECHQIASKISDLIHARGMMGVAHKCRDVGRLRHVLATLEALGSGDNFPAFEKKGDE